ncbi:MAG: glycosyl hydrolase [Pyrinomonadaceae bacterium]|nr:glycosyl hydrolase [Pyrinomonadaceae bacterium]
MTGSLAGVSQAQQEQQTTPPQQTPAQPPPQNPPQERTIQQGSTQQAAAARERANPDPIKGLKWRLIGPHRGGRVTAVAGVPSQPYIYYFGATGGGVWKTTDGGITWEPITDNYFKTGSVGAIAVADSDPNVLYVGMGESPIRGNVSHGDGVYKSTDAGKTWKRIGLENTRHIARIRVHPRNPDLVYVAALGHAFGASDERGVFRSKDGGKTWERILFRSPKAGAIDLTFDPTNANILYAGFWEVLRTPYSLESGGAGSGIFKSTDGGDTWTEITRNPGLPRGTVGKIGITVSPVNPERVWAIIEAEDGGVFRSDNAGQTWTRTNENRNLRQRAWYYTRIYADPQNADSVYVLNVSFHKSNDGGRTFTTIGTPHGDNHDLWIAPNDAARMIESNDGGANVTFNAGKTWTEQDQATAQFYRVALDGDFPYHIYGAQQDNSTVRIASRSADFAITERDWYDVGGGESGWIAPSPKDSNIVFAGSYGGLITRYDHRTGQQRDVSPYPNNPMGSGAGVLKYRFQWNFPILFSPHDANTLYTGGNVLIRSTNEGQSWQVISPDLTRNDKSKQGSSGGPITKDNTSVEYYSTIFTAMESPVQAGVIWTGSDDGTVYVTRDAGKNWNNVTPRGIPEFIQINSIEASPHEAGTAYVAATMYKWDDFRPYLYKTTDYGRTWTKITNGIPDGAFTRVIREDPNKRGLLYAGTETGIYMSYDDGANWQSLQLNLPIVPVTDLAVHKRDRDLVVATQGRSFWVLDDLNVLQGMTPSVAFADAQLFQPEDAYRTTGGSFPIPTTASVGQNPAMGAIVYFYLRNKPQGEVALEFLDSSGKVVKRFTSRREEAGSASAGRGGEGGERGEGGFGGGGGEPRFSAEAGLNRFVWDLRYPDASRFPGMILWGASTRGPRVAPGTYTVRLSANGVTSTQTFNVEADPRLTTTQEDFNRQLALLLQIRDKVTETHDAINTIRDVRKQLEGISERVKDQPNGNAVIEAAKGLMTRMAAIEEELYQTKLQSNQDPLNYPIRLNNKLAALSSVVESADTAPTEQAYALYEDLGRQIDAQLSRFNQVMQTDLPAFNRAVRDQNIPAVIVRARK